ncbi:MAG TPA: thioredoxin family protein [Candidatus Binatia bacterium]|nr:thioredoxin family protein [Candidatus Binatia bacterium]
MAAQSRMVELGSTAPDFTLPDAAGGAWALAKVAGDKPVLVAFICNHCPYVVHIADAFANFAREYQDKGLAVVAIGANDVRSHPQDGPDKMGEFARAHNFTFPYLYDETQETAKAYGAVCTPDLFLFDANKKLVYRGQFDSTRPGRGAPTGADLRAAADAVLAGRKPSADQTPSVGCSIKWKPGNAPE